MKLINKDKTAENVLNLLSNDMYRYNDEYMRGVREGVLMSCLLIVSQKDIEEDYSSSAVVKCSNCKYAKLKGWSPDGNHLLYNCNLMGNVTNDFFCGHEGCKNGNA